MKFIKVLAVYTIATLAFNVAAQSDDILRRATQSETTITQVEEQERSETLNININNNNNMGTATSKVSKVIEARPVPESQAERLRQARLNAEVQTEQKIVEKLEVSRLKEERDRAERLFGNRMDAPCPPPAQPPAAKALPEKEARISDRPASPVQIYNIEIVQPSADRNTRPSFRSSSGLRGG